MKTVHFFAFYLHNLQKITDFSPWSSMNLKIAKSLHFDRNGWGCSAASPFFWCAIYLLQMRNQSSSNFNFCIFEFLLLLLWWFTPAFMMRWLNTDWIPMDIALILFLPLNAIFSCREYKIFRPRKYLFPAERILCSIWEYTSFLTRMKCIQVKNEVYSRKEWSAFS